MEQELTWKSILHLTQSELSEGRCCLETDGHADCGKTIADFEIVSEVDSNDKNNVYKVMNGEKEVFAAKVCYKTKELVPYQLNEIEILTKLQGLKNENIVRFEHLFEIGDFRILVLEWLDTDLFDAFNNGLELDLKMIRVLISKLVKVLKLIHKQNIAYLDLKTENIMFNKDGIVKLVDFDMSYQFGHDYPRDFNPIGTVTYAAPEQVRSEYSKSSDWFNIGNFTLECLNGKTFNETFFDETGVYGDDDDIDIKTKLKALRELKTEFEIGEENDTPKPVNLFLKDCLKINIEERIDLDKTDDDLRDVEFLKDIGPTDEEKFVHLMKEYVEAKLANGSGSYLLQY